MSILYINIDTIIKNSELLCTKLYSYTTIKTSCCLKKLSDRFFWAKKSFLSKMNQNYLPKSKINDKSFCFYQI